MKKKGQLLVAILLTFVLLVACNDAAPTGNDGKKPTAATQTVKPSEEPNTVTTDGPVTTVEPTTGADKKPFAAKEYGTYLDENLVSYAPTGLDMSKYGEVSLYGDYAVLIADSIEYEYDDNLNPVPGSGFFAAAVYDLYEEKVEAEKNLPTGDFYNYIRTSDQWISVPNGQKLDFYNYQLELCFSVSGVDTDSMNYFLTPDGNSVLFSDYSNGGLLQVDVSAATDMEAVLVEHFTDVGYCNLFGFSDDGAYFCFSYFDDAADTNIYCVYDWKTDSIVCSTDLSYMGATICGGKLLGYECYDEYYLLRSVDVENDETVCDSVYCLNFPTPVYGTSITVFRRSVGNSLYLSAYDMNGNLISGAVGKADQIGQANFGYNGNRVWLSEENCLVTVSEDMNHRKSLLFWFLEENAAFADEEVVTAKSEEDFFERFDKIIEDLREKIESNYGVTIWIRDEISQLFETEFILTQQDNRLYLYNALRSVDGAFSQLPEGFVQQLCFGDYTSFHIGIAATIISEYEWTVGEAGGYTTTTDEYIEIALSQKTDADISRTVFHELSHVIDRKLAYEYDVNGKGYFDEGQWSCMNPEGFEYTANYGSYLVTEVEGAEDYFINSYGMTYPTEDRATIFEDATTRCFILNEEGLTKSQKLMDKYFYYCSCIRGGFDTTDWPETTVWEEMVEIWN